ncbi:MAG: class I SAM-dependent methyltransferase [Rhodoferax sp.]|uniref:class I SAM-dependent methyltransferase n=1 Tax=Rhodoferax sp. TaxID=50421 RepID=UPI00140088BE|nr:class I SAM-dependent methyltransferase [Rhodoferax sp.]NDP38241.1 class I SAM-dependent methyltransferase [Rhodoferax sp.]
MTIELILLVSTAILLSLITAYLTVCLYKIKKVHLVSFELLRNSNATRREVESLFSQVQYLLALERKLGLHDALPSMRGWAGSPDFLLKTAEEALRRKPQTVMECSSGVSTVVLARCLQLNGTGHVYSLENSPEFAIKTRALLEQHGLADWATVLDAPLVTQSTQSPWYDESAIPAELTAIDMLVVDGPPASTAPLARYPALPRLHPRMSENCTVMLDDADRSDEVEILRRWKQEFAEFEQTHLECEKGLVKLSRRSTRS